MDKNEHIINNNANWTSSIYIALTYEWNSWMMDATIKRFFFLFHWINLNLRQTIFLLCFSFGIKSIYQSVHITRRRFFFGKKKNSSIDKRNGMRWRKIRKCNTHWKSENCLSFCLSVTESKMILSLKKRMGKLSVINERISISSFSHNGN